LKLTFHGAAGTVTGSSHLLEACGKRVLLDCGMFQGRRAESDALNRAPGFDPSSVDAILLSHAHIDHAGLIPLVVREGFRGAIHCTSATRDLAAMLLADSARIQVADSEYVSERHGRRGDPPVDPLYTPEDAAAAMQSFVTAPYGHRIEILPGLSVRFLDAGHILGSSQIEITCAEGGDSASLLYSGDLGRPAAPVLRDPDLSSRPDCLLMESTYGGRASGTPVEASAKLGQALSDTFARGGKVIIPAFSVGRTQEILYYLRILLGTGGIPKVPVFVDSPLSYDATEVYRLHPECYDSDTRELIHSGRSPFQFQGLQFVQTVEGSRALNSIRRPMVIISASGMCEHGRILHHLKHNIEDPASTILIVGFMAKNTLGRRLADRDPVIRIFGDEYERKAEVRILNGFSAHADSDGLVAYARAVGSRARRVILVHGEPDQTQALRRRLRAEAGIDALAPSSGETVGC
jgi:metallo-beta-lactamase family protein